VIYIYCRPRVVRRKCKKLAWPRFARRRGDLIEPEEQRARLPAVSERLAHGGGGDYVSRLVPKTDPLGAESS